MATTVGIVYSAVNKIIRRIIVPDNDAELADPSHLMPGETMMVVDQGAWFKTPDPSYHFEQKTGSKPGDPRCCIVENDTNIVTMVVAADPLLDPVPPGQTMIFSATEKAGFVFGQTPPPPPPTQKGPSVAPIADGNVEVVP